MDNFSRVLSLVPEAGFVDVAVSKPEGTVVDVVLPFAVGFALLQGIISGHLLTRWAKDRPEHRFVAGKS